MQKVEARKWNFVKETFQDYAMEKLVLMKNLKLPERDTIHLLINEIDSRLLRELAVALRVHSVDGFLEEMQRITASSGESFKKPQSSFTKSQNIKVPSKDSSATDTNQAKDIFCVNCRSKGHIRNDCFKLKKKEKFQPQQSLSAAPVAAVDQMVSSSSSMVPVSSSMVSFSSSKVSSSIATGSQIPTHSSTVAVVTENLERRIEISDSHLKVTTLNNHSCNITALLDTGSPVSFICSSVFEKYCGSSVPVQNSINHYKALNNFPIKIIGSISTSLVLDALPNTLTNVNFHILEDDSFSLKIIIGRDFIKNNKLMVFYNPSGENLNNRIELFQEVASTEVMDKQSLDLESVLSDVNIDFNNDVKKQLISTIIEVQKTMVPPNPHDYMVKVALKDESTYAYASRKFAWSERQQIRVITDLLERGIIKYSISPYCARVIPVRKKNGSLRLCIDLRPLNDRARN